VYWLIEGSTHPATARRVWGEKEVFPLGELRLATKCDLETDARRPSVGIKGRELTGSTLPIGMPPAVRLDDVGPFLDQGTKSPQSNRGLHFAQTSGSVIA
jgi:hypothetical protein